MHGEPRGSRVRARRANSFRNEFVPHAPYAADSSRARNVDPVPNHKSASYWL